MSLTPSLVSGRQFEQTKSVSATLKSVKDRLSRQAYGVLACLLGSYFLADAGYRIFVAPYTNLWPADYKLISLILIIPPSIFVFAREILGLKIGARSKAANYLLLISFNALFIAAISADYYIQHPIPGSHGLRPMLWATCWLVVPFMIVEAPRVWVQRGGLANRLRPRIAIISSPDTPVSPAALETMAILCGEFRSRAVAFEGIYTPDESAGATFSTKGGVSDLFSIGQTRTLNRIVLAGFSPEAAADIAQRLIPLATDIFIHQPGDDGSVAPSLQLIARRPLSSTGQTLKMLEDFGLGALFLVIFGPLMAFIALAIWLESPGPIFFKQKRHGYRYREVEVFKFRTMRVDTLDYGCAQQTRKGDPRITRVGRFLRKSSLDELPQLLNVIRGEMSLVGPRPHAVTMRTAQRLSHEIVPHYANRHCVKPGITGWAQINGHRGAMDFEEQLANRVEFDLEYIKKCSVVFDFYILFKTVFHLASPKNAF